MLFPSLAPLRPPASIDLRCADTADVIATLAPDSVDLVFIDPPWEYAQSISGSGVGASDHYICLPMSTILAHLAAIRTKMRKGGRCVLWTTHSQEPELSLHLTRGDDDKAYLAGWRYVSGGSWAKVGEDESRGGRGAPGIGYHCLSSEAEPWWLLLGDGPHDRANVAGCRVIPRHRGRGEQHSAKPLEYQREMVRGWCPPGGLVYDVYAGLGSVAAACKLEGRNYIGAEIDPERHAEAMRLAAVAE
jgi:hypothetical protein